MFAAMMQNSGYLLAGAVIAGMFLLFALGIALTVFWIMMIIDCAQRKNLTDGERVVWILVLVFLGFFGASIYYLAVKRK